MPYGRENYAEGTVVNMASSAENVSSGCSGKNTRYINFICQQY